uniref:Uncharacterized protein n=1 Tax=Arundo donax TaxID=35708 RepID=A0A0A9DG70_ARUDO
MTRSSGNIQYLSLLFTPPLCSY